ncbi:MAG: hypothetical protein COB53_11885 [Elusimicrobia bacterium]|nr:MAG: hypothetical protein COB53_11885 [Elusimicrobiota bacterium]
MTDWWKKAFIDGAFPVAESVDSPAFKKMTRIELPFITKSLELKRGAALLDVCCGTGRHSIPLARKGMAVTGIDVSKRFLKRARCAGSKARFLERDMRALGFKSEFDAAINMWSSFGYFERASDDLKTLRSIRQALKPGGRLLMQTINGARVRGILQWMRDRQVPTDHWSEFAPHCFVLERPRLIRKDSVVETEWTILRGKRRDQLTSRIRLYDGDSLSRLLIRAGFSIRSFSGDCDGSAYDPSDSLRIVIIAQK